MIIRHNRLEGDADAQVVETLDEKEGIRILEIRASEVPSRRPGFRF